MNMRALNPTHLLPYNATARLGLPLAPAAAQPVMRQAPRGAETVWELLKQLSEGQQ